MTKENSEQIRLVRRLKQRGILYCHVPNGGWRSKREAQIFKMMGVQAGFPDLLIFDPPPAKKDCIGVALEIKKVRGGRVSTEQKGWLLDLSCRGWYTNVVEGAQQGIDLLFSLGYDVGPQEKRGISPQAVADLFGVSRRTMYRWMKQGLTPPYEKNDGVITFSEEEVQQWFTASLRSR